MRLLSEYVLELTQIPSANELIYTLKWAGSNIHFARDLASRIYENIITLISKQGWSEQTVRNVLNKIQVVATANAVIVKSKDRVFNILELGRRASRPTKESRSSVPLRLGNGQLIFRRITFKSILEGKWRVPARPGLKLIELAIKQSLAEKIQESELKSPLIFQKLRQLVQQRL
ncbi:MAG: hypothetical protein QXE80_03285 [Pyrobaculum sp.]